MTVKEALFGREDNIPWRTRLGNIHTSWRNPHKIEVQPTDYGEPVHTVTEHYNGFPFVTSYFPPNNLANAPDGPPPYIINGGLFDLTAAEKHHIEALRDLGHAVIMREICGLGSSINFMPAIQAAHDSTMRLDFPYGDVVRQSSQKPIYCAYSTNGGLSMLAYASNQGQHEERHARLEENFGQKILMAPFAQPPIAMSAFMMAAYENYVEQKPEAHYGDRAYDKIYQSIRYALGQELIGPKIVRMTGPQIIYMIQEFQKMWAPVMQEWAEGKKPSRDHTDNDLMILQGTRDISASYITNLRLAQALGIPFYRLPSSHHFFQTPKKMKVLFNGLSAPEGIDSIAREIPGIDFRMLAYSITRSLGLGSGIDLPMPPSFLNIVLESLKNSPSTPAQTI